MTVVITHYRYKRPHPLSVPGRDTTSRSTICCTTHPLPVRPPHKARHRLSQAPCRAAIASRNSYAHASRRFADVRMQVLAHGRAVVDHRVDQVLEGEFWPLAVACVDYGGCR